MTFVPSYIKLFESGELEKRSERLQKILSSCTLCPRKCKVDRTAGETGVCEAGADVMISSAFPHFGEEAPLVGLSGSGTIFMTHCNLRCEFCQNADISHEGRGEVVSPRELADYMLALERRGCHNINFVTPTHYVPQIVKSLSLAIEGGLSVPIVYNTGGYDSIEVIKLLTDIVDIYMPDYKFTDRSYSKKFMNAPDYPEVIKSVLKEMHHQVGVLKTDSRGIAYRGLLIRHLVMPGGIQGTAEAARFIARELSTETYVNIMEQYRPEYKAFSFPELKRRITGEEYLDAVRLARDAGLSRGF
jgi:putative pyruvate formate lyase activating enzyme